MRLQPTEYRLPPLSIGWAVAGIILYACSQTTPTGILRAPLVLGSFIIFLAIPGFILSIALTRSSQNLSVILSLPLGLLFLTITTGFAYLAILIVPIGMPTGDVLLMSTITLGVLVWTLIGEICPNNDSRIHDWALGLPKSQGAILAALTPIVAVSGSLLMTESGNNMILLLFVGFAALSMLIMVTNHIPGRYHGFAIYAVSLGLLFHKSLISPTVWGWDIQLTHYTLHQILEAGVWTPGIENRRIPLIGILFPGIALNQLGGLSVETILKVVYPAIFATLPVSIYRYVKLAATDQIAVTSALLYAATFLFYKVIPGKQQFALLFMILFAIWLISFRSETHIWLGLALITGTVISHYATGYLFLLILIGAKLLAQLLNMQQSDNPRRVNLSRNSVPWLFACILFVWYTQTAQSVIFRNVVYVHFVSIRSLLELLVHGGEPGGRTAAAVVTSQSSSIWESLYKGMHVVVQAGVAVGIVLEGWRLLTDRELTLSPYHLALAIPVGIPLAGSVLLAGSFGIDRVIVFSLLLTAPYAVIGAIGGIAFVRTHIFSSGSMNRASMKRAYQILGVCLVIYLLFNSKVAYYALGVDAQTFPLTRDGDDPAFVAEDEVGALWVAQYSTMEDNVTSDGYGRLILLQKLGKDDRIQLLRLGELPSSCFFESSGAKRFNQGRVLDDEITVTTSLGWLEESRERNRVYTAGPTSVSCW